MAKTSDQHIKREAMGSSYNAHNSILFTGIKYSDTRLQKGRNQVYRNEKSAN